MWWLTGDARPSLLPLFIAAVSLATASLAESDPPCSATSNRTSTFVDLHSLIKKEGNYTFRSSDYNSNFTLNICAPLLVPDSLQFESLPDTKNLSAYYRKGGKVYSLGRASTTPRFNGKKLVLDYSGGSLCPKLDSEGIPIEGEYNDAGYRKGLTLSFMCDRDLLVPATISFVSQKYDCSYWLEVRTPSACATNKPQALGPVSIFGIISLVALLVYFVGGCFYSRTVLQARGWRQVPHWQTWLRTLNFIWDGLRICLYSLVNMCSRLVGRGRTGRYGGYVSGAGDGRFSRANEWADVDDENRLIDQLDDEWSDG
ncbi:hypothetical protein DRE_01375 [Drechslerella stenobrocha 248]|uniref:Autophagy-related protein 27 n=1 Tax=Drechslerella stenobrocha 248 TaxID=1043628 RepID=W7HVW6_9PEZI|nr:hypothetical protein DRE_01375 [Drechslerella stenobrocha 248]